MNFYGPEDEDDEIKQEDLDTQIDNELDDQDFDDDDTEEEDTEEDTPETQED